MMPMIRRQFLSSGAAAMLAAGSGAAWAQTVSGKSVRMVVPYGVGGGADFSARLIAQKLMDTSGIKMIIDNKPGASGIVGTDFVAKAPADGSVLLYCDTTHALNTAVNPRVPYDPVADFKPLTLIGRSPQLLVAHPSFPANSLTELLAMPREKTRDMAIGSSGLGSTPHMTYERLHLMTGLTLVHVPYKGGGPALNDAVTGQIPLVVNSIPACIPHLQGRRLKALAVASAERNPRMPEVQTFAESGAALEVSTWYGVLSPARTSQEITDKLAREIERALDDADIKVRFDEAFLDPMPRGEQAFATFLGEEIRQWKAIAAQTGIVVD